MNQSSIEVIIEQIKNLETPSKLNSIEKLFDVNSNVNLKSKKTNNISKYIY